MIDKQFHFSKDTHKEKKEIKVYGVIGIFKGCFNEQYMFRNKKKAESKRKEMLNVYDSSEVHLNKVEIE